METELGSNEPEADYHKSDCKCVGLANVWKGENCCVCLKYMFRNDI